MFQTTVYGKEETVTAQIPDTFIFNSPLKRRVGGISKGFSVKEQDAVLQAAGRSTAGLLGSMVRVNRENSSDSRRKKALPRASRPLGVPAR